MLVHYRYGFIIAMDYGVGPMLTTLSKVHRGVLRNSAVYLSTPRRHLHLVGREDGF